MTYTVYTSNDCESCERVLNYLKGHHILHTITNIDTYDKKLPVNVFIVPALFFNNKLLAYGLDIVKYFEKQQA